jgi:serine/threonine-protein kinase
MTKLLDRYTLGEHVASGPVADAYRATDDTMGRTVTVRMLRANLVVDAGRCEALLAAARPVLPLSHPNIAALFDVGEDQGRPFLVFEHTSGQTLRSTVSGSPMNVRRALDFGAQLADALAEAHGLGLVHGGLNPESIIITAKGRPKILDFGLASWVALASDGTPSTPLAESTGLSPEDVECLAPEQVLGEHGDARADLFSFGCVLFEMLTGTQPFAAATSADTAMAILSRTPPPPSQLNARVPPALDALVVRCLAKSLDRRADAAASLAARLRGLTQEMEAEKREERKFDLPRPRTRRPIPAWVLVLVGGLWLGLLAGILYFFWLR